LIIFCPAAQLPFGRVIGAGDWRCSPFSGCLRPAACFVRMCTVCRCVVGWCHKGEGCCCAFVVVGVCRHVDQIQRWRGDEERRLRRKETRNSLLGPHRHHRLHSALAATSPGGQTCAGEHAARPVRGAYIYPGPGTHRRRRITSSLDPCLAPLRLHPLSLLTTTAREKRAEEPSLAVI
jgi:hypothetical protein